MKLTFNELQDLLVSIIQDEQEMIQDSSVFILQTSLQMLPRNITEILFQNLYNKLRDNNETKLTIELEIDDV